MTNEEQEGPWVAYEVRAGVDKRLRIDGPGDLRMYLNCDVGGDAFVEIVEAADEIVRLLNAGWGK